MDEKWFVTMKKADFRGIAKQFQLDPVIARLIHNRDVVGEKNIEKYLHGTLQDLYDPRLMKDLVKAAEILRQHLKEKKLRIIGDYDIDGIMSSYILWRGLTRLGAAVDVRIPDRIRDGYGLNERLIREAGEDGIDLIITCDNGIAAAKEISLANSLGMVVIVTDHHEVPYEMCGEEKHYTLPPAAAVVDPKQEDCPYPYKGLCGAGVAFKLICYMYEEAGIPFSEAEDLLEYTAFATIGDVMDLTDENRIIVREGMERLRRTENLGLQQLILLNHLEPANVDVYHVGFVLGPCLNASGRLNTAMHALAMLMAREVDEAAGKAGDLIALNASRKEMTRRGEELAAEQVENTAIGENPVLVIYLPEVHESIAGIIAGRIKEKYYKPVFVITDTEEGLKGSGRSIEAYDMFAELNKCKECFTKFGGHKMAAGISMEKTALEDFRRKINACCTLTAEDMIQKVSIDLQMPISYVSENLIRQMEVLKPFGNANTKPIFAERKLSVCNPRVFGKNRNVVKMLLQDQRGYRIDAVYFGDGDAFADYVSTHPQIDITYYPAIDSYRGRNSLQLTITRYR